MSPNLKICLNLLFLTMVILIMVQLSTSLSDKLSNKSSFKSRNAVNKLVKQSQLPNADPLNLLNDPKMIAQLQTKAAFGSLTNVIITAKNLTTSNLDPLKMISSAAGLANSLAGLLNEGIDIMTKLIDCATKTEDGRVTNLLKSLFQIDVSLITSKIDGFVTCVSSLKALTQIPVIETLLQRMKSTFDAIGQNSFHVNTFTKASLLEVGSGVTNFCLEKVNHNLIVSSRGVQVLHILGDFYKMFLHVVKFLLAPLRTITGLNVGAQAATMGGEAGIWFDFSQFGVGLNAPFNVVYDLVKIVTRSVLVDIYINCPFTNNQTTQMYSIIGMLESYNSEVFTN
jgi:hypothetical protein